MARIGRPRSDLSRQAPEHSINLLFHLRGFATRLGNENSINYEGLKANLYFCIKYETSGD